MVNATSPSATDRVIEELRSRILSGEIPAGAPLQQVALAADLGVSRIPVRDAIRSLAAERLVDLQANSSAVVAGLSVADLEELYELRLAFEPVLSRRGLADTGRATILQMQVELETMERSEDVVTWLAANDRFHRLLYAKADRPWLVEILDQARGRTSRYTKLLITEMSSRPIDDLHRKILEAATRNDGEALERHIRDHMTTGHDFVLKRLLEEPGMEAGTEHGR